MGQALTKPPEDAAGEADGKEQPDLVKALLGSRQETALQQLRTAVKEVSSTS